MAVRLAKSAKAMSGSTLPKEQWKTTQDVSIDKSDRKTLHANLAGDNVSRLQKNTLSKQ